MTDIMCNRQDVKEMVYEAFDEKDGIRSQIQSDTRREIKLAAFQLLTAIGITLLISIISLTVYLTTIRNDVDNLTALVNGPVDIRINENRDTIKNLATKDDIRRVEDALIRLDAKISE